MGWLRSRYCHAPHVQPQSASVSFSKKKTRELPHELRYLQHVPAKRSPSRRLTIGTGRQHTLLTIGCFFFFAIFLLLLGWKTCKNTPLKQTKNIPKNISSPTKTIRLGKKNGMKAYVYRYAFRLTFRGLHLAVGYYVRRFQHYHYMFSCSTIVGTSQTRYQGKRGVGGNRRKLPYAAKPAKKYLVGDLLFVLPASVTVSQITVPSPEERKNTFCFTTQWVLQGDPFFFTYGTGESASYGRKQATDRRNGMRFCSLAP